LGAPDNEREADFNNDDDEDARNEAILDNLDESGDEWEADWDESGDEREADWDESGDEWEADWDESGDEKERNGRGGDPDDEALSLLLQRLSSEDLALLLPPVQPLNAEDLAISQLPLLQPLNTDDQQKVIQALNDNGPPTQVIAQDGNDTVQRESMHRLLPDQWLNDEVINFYMVMLSKRDKETCLGDPSRTRCHFSKSFFVSRLFNEGHTNPAIDGEYEYNSVKTWSNNVPGTCFLAFLLLCLVRVATALTILMVYHLFAEKDIFKLDKIVFPINIGKQHWVCAVIYMQEKRIQFFDSMGDDGTLYLESLFEYVKDEHQDKKGSPLPDQDQWRLVLCTSVTPRQLNGTSFFSNGCFRLLLLFLALLTFSLSSFCFV
jgi:hypothetical protein